MTTTRKIRNQLEQVLARRPFALDHFDRMEDKCTCPPYGPNWDCLRVDAQYYMYALGPEEVPGLVRSARAVLKLLDRIEQLS